MALDPGLLLKNHTIFPYATAFLAAEPRNRWTSLLINTSNEAHVCKASTTITQSVTERIQARRMCPQCMLEDKANYGESYWHRSHCLPATYYCLKHDCWLVNTVISGTRPNGSDNYLLPQHTTKKRGRIHVDISVAKQLAQYSIALLDCTGGLCWTEEYQRLATEKGFLRRDNAFAGLALEYVLTKFYSPSLLQDARLKQFQPGNKTGWPGQLLRPFQPSALAVTVKHILLRVFLENTKPPELEQAYSKPGRRPGNQAQKDKDLAKTVRKLIRKAEQAGSKLKVSEVLMQAGGWADFRHKRHLYPLTKIEIKKLRCSKTSIRPVLPP